jgi:hypothetical protein
MATGDQTVVASGRIVEEIKRIIDAKKVTGGNE